jgi:hypothetical protein
MPSWSRSRRPWNRCGSNKIGIAIKNYQQKPPALGGFLCLSWRERSGCQTGPRGKRRTAASSEICGLMISYELSGDERSRQIGGCEGSYD